MSYKPPYRPQRYLRVKFNPLDIRVGVRFEYYQLGPIASSNKTRHVLQIYINIPMFQMIIYWGWQGGQS